MKFLILSLEPVRDRDELVRKGSLIDFNNIFASNNLMIIPGQESVLQRQQMMYGIVFFQMGVLEL